MAILEALDRMTPVSGSSTVVSPENFIKCLKKFYSHWKEDVYGLWGSPGAIAVATPPYSDDIRYRKSLALSMWFFGRDFADTIMVFLSSQIHFLSGQDGCDLLEHLKMPVSKAVGLDIVLHNIEKAGNGSLSMDQILNSVCAQYESNGVVMGHIAREKPEGKVLEEWYQKLHGSRFILPAEHYSSYQPNRPEDDGGPVVSHGMRWSARQGMLTQRWAVSRTARMRGSGGGRKQRPSLAILVSHRPRVPRRRGSD